MTGGDDDLARLRDRETERTVLGQVLTWADTWVLYRDAGLQVDDFWHTPHRDIFTAINAVDTDALVPDVPLVLARLRDMGVYEAVGPGYVTGLLDGVPKPAASNVAGLTSRLRSLATARAWVAGQDRRRTRLLANPALVGNGFFTEQRAWLDTLDGVPESHPALLDDVSIAHCPTPPEIVAGRLPADALGLLIGPPGTAKSLVTLSLAVDILTGRPWFGASVVRGVVLWILAEGGPARFARRIRAAKLARGLPLDQSIGFHIWPQPVNLRDVSAVATLVTLVRRVAPVLIVLDTYSRCAIGIDENAAQDTSVIVGALDQLRAASGADVLAVHHTPKDGRLEPRGSTVLTGAVDTILATQRFGTDRLQLACLKQRDGALFAPLRLRLDPVAESVVPVLVASDEAPVLDDRLDTAILAALATGPLSGSRLAASLHQDRSLVFARLRRLEAVGRIEQTGQGPALRWRLL
jgi:hypothetical protein